MTPNNLPLNPGADWPYGYGMCCCGCGKKARMVGGALQKYYRKYHEQWQRERKQREIGASNEEWKSQLPKRQVAERTEYPITDDQIPLPEDQKTTRPNKFAIAKHLPDAFNVSQPEVNKIYTNEDRGSPTASERERQFPHLSAPTVELKNRFKKVAVESGPDRPGPEQPELSGGKAKPDRLDQQLAWIKANQPLLEAISRARDRADIAVKGAYIRHREKVDSEFRLLQRIRGRISAVLKGGKKNSSTLKLIGCTLPELKAHLEKQFKTGMSWSNYGEWHVDHIRPCASFNFNDPASLCDCFHYTNLQPMWKLDNIKKNSNWEGKLIRRKNLE
jgi:alkylated DNA nucleotide flippase Atl1